MFAAITAQRAESRGKKSAPAIMELTIDPVSVLKNVKPTMAASVVAMDPIHESPWESFLGFLLGGGQRLDWRCKISRMIGTSLSQHPQRTLTKLSKVWVSHRSIFQKNQTELNPGQPRLKVSRRLEYSDLRSGRCLVALTARPLPRRTNRPAVT